MTEKNYIYPIIVSYETDEKAPQYFISIPDFDGFTQAETLEGSVSMARDYIGNCMIELEEKGESLPTVDFENIKRLEKEKDLDVVMLVDIDYKKFKAASDNRTIKKTLTIPNYLNVLAIENNVNFSEVLTEALKEKLHA